MVTREGAEENNMQKGASETNINFELVGKATLAGGNRNRQKKVEENIKKQKYCLQECNEIKEKI